MSKMPVLVALASLAVGLAACGGAGSNARSHSSTAARTPDTGAATTVAAPPPPKTDIDGDTDNPDEYRAGSRYDDDDIPILRYGRPASADDRRDVGEVVKRYYVAAAANDGTAGCSLLYALVAESVPEDYGQPPGGSPSLSGKTCAVVMSKLFALHHKELASDAATLRVTGVRVKRNSGEALLRFGSGSVRYIPVHSERGVWKIDTLRDAGLA